MDSQVCVHSTKADAQSSSVNVQCCSPHQRAEEEEEEKEEEEEEEEDEEEEINGERNAEQKREAGEKTVKNEGSSFLPPPSHFAFLNF